MIGLVETSVEKRYGGLSFTSWKVYVPKGLFCRHNLTAWTNENYGYLTAFEDHGMPLAMPETKHSRNSFSSVCVRIRFLEDGRCSIVL